MTCPKSSKIKGGRCGIRGQDYKAPRSLDPMVLPMTEAENKTYSGGSGESSGEKQKLISG